MPFQDSSMKRSQETNMNQPIPEPDEPEYFLESFPRDAFPAYLWTERPANLPSGAWRFMTSSAASPEIQELFARLNSSLTGLQIAWRWKVRWNAITPAPL